VRPLVITILITTLLWWLFRPRRNARRTARYAVAEKPTYRAVKTFRAPGGVATTVYKAVWRNGGPVQQWHSWTCDCGGEVEGYKALWQARREAIAHYESHVRGAA
jgi:hypothetical protein